MMFVKTFEDYLGGQEKFDRNDLSKLKISGKKNSLSYKLKNLMSDEIVISEKNFETLKDDVMNILNDPELVASKSTINYWKYEIEVTPDKDTLISTIYNIILSSEGLGLMAHDRHLRK